MSREFLTTQKALVFYWTLDDKDGNDLVDIYNELGILRRDRDALGEIEEINDSSTRNIEEKNM